MAEVATERALRVFTVLNPKSGSYSADEVRRALGHHFRCGEGTCEVHEIGDGGDDLKEVVRAAVDRGVDLVVAAGGDGTVSAVANGLVATPTPLGILPIGTANVLARELGIPVDLEGACRMLAGKHTTRRLDAMRVGDRVFFTQAGVGIDALMIRDTKTEHKRRFGRLAYLWTGFTRLIGFQPRRFSLEVDGRPSRPRASQVLVANCGILGQPPFRWGPGIRPDDGRLDVCVVRARTLVDYLALAWHFARGQHGQDPNVRYLRAERTVSIDSDRPLPVQADGEIIGETPVVVEVVPSAVRFLVPPASDPSPTEGEDVR